MAEELDLQELMTRPLSEAELLEYQDVLSSEAFEEMVRMYHASAAIDSIRNVILSVFEQGLRLESMTILLANVWLDCVGELDKRIGAESLNVWRKIPKLLSQILIQNALLVLLENQDNEDLIQDPAPELADLYQKWIAKMPKPLTEAEAAESLVPQEELTARFYELMTDFRLKLEQESQLKLQKGNYLEIWTLILMQAYIFSFDDQPRLYYLIESNWGMVLSSLAQMLDLMSVLQGMEHLLLPEYREQLNSMIASGAFASQAG